MSRIIVAFTIVSCLGIAVIGAGRQAPTGGQQPQQPSDLGAVITGEGAAAPRLAVPDFIALSSDAETVAIAKTLSQVLFDDLNFEKEFALIPRDTYGTIPAAITPMPTLATMVNAPMVRKVDFISDIGT